MAPAEGRPADRLRLARLARGFSQGELARIAGVTRQAISGIEAGRWSPSLDVALALARAFDLAVEDLFGQEREPPPVAARLAAGELTPPAARVLVSEIAGDPVCFPLTGDVSFAPGFLPALGLAQAPGGEGGERTRRRRPDGIDVVRLVENGPMLSVAGCDPALPLLQGPLGRCRPPVGLVWWPCGNSQALELMKKGLVHVAALHRGRQKPFRLPPQTSVVGFAAWREGLALSPRLSGEVTDLAGVVEKRLRIANREVGSEARALLDARLAGSRLDPADVAGYETTVSAHMLVASAIASGLADAGVTTEPAALSFGLDFSCWQEELCELAIARKLVGSPEIRALFEVLGGRELPRQLATIPGYDAETCGRVMAG